MKYRTNAELRRINRMKDIAAAVVLGVLFATILFLGIRA